MVVQWIEQVPAKLPIRVRLPAIPTTSKTCNRANGCRHTTHLGWLEPECAVATAFYSIPAAYAKGIGNHALPAM